jgi:hypothetical protein
MIALAPLDLLPEALGEEVRPYLVVGSPTALETAAPLLEHRRRNGRTVETLVWAGASRDETMAAAALRLRSAIRARAAQGPVPEILLLGDASGTDASDEWMLPVFHVPASLVGGYDRPLIASDGPYGMIDHDDLPDAPVGRLPARSARELARLVEKTLAYERELHSRPRSTRQLAFVAGEGRFGRLADGLLETVFRRLVADQIPDRFEVVVTQVSRSSSYALPPELLTDHLLRLLGPDGPAILTYVGHGARGALDRVEVAGRMQPLLAEKDALRLTGETPGPPFFALACSVGQFDEEKGRDSLAERLLEIPGGPVAVVASSRVSRPYGNALLGKEWIDALLRPAPGTAPTLGAALLRARRNLLGEPDALRRSFDLIASLFVRDQERLAERTDHTLLYNLLGDPALPLPFAVADLAPTVRVLDGRLQVRGDAPVQEGECLVSIEVPRSQFVQEPRVEGAPADEATHALANRKAIREARVAIVGGRWEVDLPDPCRRPLLLKALAILEHRAVAFGATRLDLPPAGSR